MATFSKDMFDESEITEAFVGMPDIKPGTYSAVIHQKDLDEAELKSRNSLELWGFEFRQIQGKKDPEKTFYTMKIPVEIKDPNFPEYDERRLTYEIWVDMKMGAKNKLTFDGGSKKNRDLAFLRGVLKQNESGTPWSPDKMVGQPLRIIVGDEEGSDGVTRTKVRKVAEPR